MVLAPADRLTLTFDNINRNRATGSSLLDLEFYLGLSLSAGSTLSSVDVRLDRLQLGSDMFHPFDFILRRAPVQSTERSSRLDDIALRPSPSRFLERAAEVIGAQAGDAGEGSEREVLIEDAPRCSRPRAATTPAKGPF